MSDPLNESRPRPARSLLGVCCLIGSALLCILSLLIPNWELQAPIVRGASSEKEHLWYFIAYLTPGLLAAIALYEGFRIRRKNREIAPHYDDATPQAMAVAGLILAYAVVDGLIYFLS
jgi:hypothetical protein